LKRPFEAGDLEVSSSADNTTRAGLVDCLAIRRGGVIEFSRERNWPVHEHE
jgi:hypothetical protein